METVQQRSADRHAPPPLGLLSGRLTVEDVDAPYRQPGGPFPRSTRPTVPSFILAVVINVAGLDNRQRYNVYLIYSTYVRVWSGGLVLSGGRRKGRLARTSAFNSSPCGLPPTDCCAGRFRNMVGQSLSALVYYPLKRRYILFEIACCGGYDTGRGTQVLVVNGQRRRQGLFL